MLRILKLAADYDCEYKLGQALIQLIDEDLSINIQHIEHKFNGSHPILPTIVCEQHILSDYDSQIPCHQTAIKTGATYATA